MVIRCFYLIFNHNRYIPLFFRGWLRIHTIKGVQKSLYTEEQQNLQSLLRQLRKDANLTQLQLAEKLQVAPSRISEYEKAGRRMDILQLRLYCKAVGTTLPDFVDRLEKVLPEIEAP